MDISRIRRGHVPLGISMLVLLLAACGGGGGGGTVRTNPPPAAPPPPPPVVGAPNPGYSKHLVVTNTAPAHAAGLSGSGIRIGVVDSGVNRNHPALSPRVVNNLVYISSNGNNLSVDDVVGHGTAVSQIMAGTPFGAWPGGIAPGAQIVSARIINDKPPVDDGSGQGNEVHGALGLKPIHQDLINRGVRIMNNSWGGLYWTDLNATAPIADEYRPFITSNNGLVVFAAGNESRSNPHDMAALPSKPGPNGTMPAADLERGWLAVVALNTDTPTVLASYSNACGIAMRYCLAAPGDVVVTGTNDSPTNPSYWTWRGTSLAAPQVSGAAALVWQAYPYFNNDLVRQTLLGTARDLGAPGVDPLFGYGSLDVGKAVNGPARFDWGTVNVALPAGSTSHWNNTISGTGGLSKGGTGTLVLGSSTNSYTGQTTVMDGVLRVRGSLGGALQIAAPGVLEVSSGGNGLRVDGSSVVNGGTLKLAPDGGLAIANGSYTQTSAARLGLYVGNVLSAQTAVLQGGDLQVLGVRSGYTAQAKENVIVTSGGLTGTFGSLSQGAGVFLQATLGYDPLSAWLDITRLDVTATAQSLGFAPASLGAAERIEGAFRRIDRGLGADGDFLAAAGDIQRSPDARAAERSLASMSGELHAADAAFARFAIDGNRRALQTHLDALAGRSRAGAWATELRDEGGLSHFGLQSNGWLIGHDAGSQNGMRMGVAMSETRSRVQASERNDHERARQVEGQAYAEWTFAGSYLLGRAALGRLERVMQREVLLGARSFRIGSDYSSRYRSMDLELGHRFGWNGGKLTPYLGFQSLRLDRDGFNEPGAAGFGLSADDSQWRADLALYGVRMSHGWNAGAARIALQAHVEWQRMLDQSGQNIDARFSALDVWSPIDGTAFGGDARTFGIGFESRWSSGDLFELTLDQRQEVGINYPQAMLRWSRSF